MVAHAGRCKRENNAHRTQSQRLMMILLATGWWGAMQTISFSHTSAIAYRALKKRTIKNCIDCLHVLFLIAIKQCFMKNAELANE